MSTGLLILGFTLGAAGVVATHRLERGWLAGVAVGALFAAGLVGGLIGGSGGPFLALPDGLGYRLALVASVAAAVGLPIVARLGRPVSD